MADEWVDFDNFVMGSRVRWLEVSKVWFGLIGGRFCAASRALFCLTVGIRSL